MPNQPAAANARHLATPFPGSQPWEAPDPVPVMRRELKLLLIEMNVLRVEVEQLRAIEREARKTEEFLSASVNRLMESRDHWRREAERLRPLIEQVPPWSLFWRSCVDAFRAWRKSTDRGTHWASASSGPDRALAQHHGQGGRGANAASTASRPWPVPPSPLLRCRPNTIGARLNGCVARNDGTCQKRLMQRHRRRARCNDLFDHLIGAGEQVGGASECLRRVEIEFELFGGHTGGSPGFLPLSMRSTRTRRRSGAAKLIIRFTAPEIVERFVFHLQNEDKGMMRVTLRARSHRAGSAKRRFGRLLGDWRDVCSTARIGAAHPRRNLPGRDDKSEPGRPRGRAIVLRRPPGVDSGGGISRPRSRPFLRDGDRVRRMGPAVQGPAPS